MHERNLFVIHDSIKHNIVIKYSQPCVFLCFRLDCFFFPGMYHPLGSVVSRCLYFGGSGGSSLSAGGRV